MVASEGSGGGGETPDSGWTNPAPHPPQYPEQQYGQQPQQPYPPQEPYGHQPQFGQQSQPHPQATTEHPTARDGGSGLSIITVAIAAVVAIVGGILVTVALTGGSNDSAAGSQPVVPVAQPTEVVVTAPTEVFLEPTQSIGTDAFFAAPDQLETIKPILLGIGPVLPPPTPTPIGAALGGDFGKVQVQPVSGSEPGLYGGTRDDSTCDRDKLVGFLESNPDKAAAWAGVQQIPPSQIRPFVDSLTPVVLLRDTRVTNHGFRDGLANPLQSVLQAGSAVLVDDKGMPRARCACGNPLKAPVAQAAPIYGEGQWSGFAPDQVQVVAPGAASSQVVLQNLDGGAPFARATGTGGTQDFDAPPAAIAAIRPDLLRTGLGDPTVSPPVGGVVVLGTAARDIPPGSGVTPFTPLSAVPPDVLINVLTPDDLADVQPAQPSAPAAGTEPTPAGGEGLESPTAAPATSAPTTPPIPTVAPPVPAAPTAAPAPTTPPAPTSPPAPTATPLPTATPVPTTPPRQLVNLTSRGSVTANSTFSGFPASFAVDGSVATSWFSTGPGAGPGVFTWSGPLAEITEVSFAGNGSHSNEGFRQGFGFSTVAIQIYRGGAPVFSGSGLGSGWSWQPNVEGDTVVLTFTGHEAPDCGGFSELTIRGYA